MQNQIGFIIIDGHLLSVDLLTSLFVLFGDDLWDIGYIAMILLECLLWLMVKMENWWC